MDLFDDLRTFATLAQTGGFAAAADRLGIVKSAVSRRIRDLEERLGTTLLHRTSRQLSLTEAGRVYLRRAEAILQSVEALDDAVRAEGHGLAGTIRIAMPVSLATNCFAADLVEFQRRYPRVSLEVFANDDIVDIVHGGIDLAIRIANLKDSSLIARRITWIRHVVCASPAYFDAHGRPNKPEDLPSHVGIGYTNMDDDDYWTFRDGQVAKPATRARVSNGDVVREMVKAGAGVAYIPTFVVADAVRDGSLEIVLEEYVRAPVPMHVVFPVSNHLPARVRALIDFLVAEYDDDPDWDVELRAGLAARGSAER